MMQSIECVFRRAKVYHEGLGSVRRISKYALIILHLSWLPRLVLLQVLAHCQVSGFRDRRAPDYTTRQMVAREGAAPPIAGCRPAVILFHHRAERNWLPGLDSHQHGRLQRAVSY